MKRVKQSAAEKGFEYKVEQTRALLDQMRNKNQPQKNSTSVNIKKSSVEHLNDRERENATRMTRGGSTDALTTNNINVNINYTVNQTIDNSTVKQRRRNGRKSQNKQAEANRAKELMNSSLSQMLDRQLLAGMDAPNKPTQSTRNVSNNKQIKDSMTHDIFHGDKIYLQEGQMAYKPLNLETVAHHYGPSKNARTTEQNIANQQRIDLASVEDFISRQRLNLMNIGVTEEPVRKKVVASSKAVRNTYQSETPV